MMASLEMALEEKLMLVMLDFCYVASFSVNVNTKQCSQGNCI